jgi:hypothetical protein
MKFDIARLGAAFRSRIKGMAESEARKPMAAYLKMPLFIFSIGFASLIAGQVFAQVPQAFAAPGESAAIAFHAEGAQIYECKFDPDNKLVWQFREPIASLLLDGKTVGRHYAGPNWEHSDGSAVHAKAVANVPGATPDDIPWLRLEVTARHGNGALSGVTAVQRVNTKGGVSKGPCDTAGSYRSVPYSADYVFLHRAE